MVLTQEDTSWHAVMVAAYRKCRTTELQQMLLNESVAQKSGICISTSRADATASTSVQVLHCTKRASGRDTHSTASSLVLTVCWTGCAKLLRENRGMAQAVHKRPPAESNDQVRQLVQQIVVQEHICSMALPHDLVPQLQIVGLEALASFAPEQVFQTVLRAKYLNGTGCSFKPSRVQSEAVRATSFDHSLQCKL